MCSPLAVVSIEDEAILPETDARTCLYYQTNPYNLIRRSIMHPAIYKSRDLQD